MSSRAALAPAPAAWSPEVGQWVHASLFELSLSAADRVTLGEGQTAQVAAPALGARLGVAELWLKREDQNPTGSHKARSLGLQASWRRARGGGPAVISSSGNAALAAAAYAAAAGLPVLVLVSPATPAVKLRPLGGLPGPVAVTATPVALLRHAVARFGCEDWRPSVHPLAATAHRGLAAELARLDPLDAVFLYASSGATVVGLAEGFQRLRAAGRATRAPAIHIVQASTTNDLVRPWVPGLPAEMPSPIADLGARRSRRAVAVRRLVEASGGRGWHVDGPALAAAQADAAACGVTTSWEGLAALAAVRAAAAQLRGQRVAVVLTGHASQLNLRVEPAPETVARVDGPAALDALLRRFGWVAEAGDAR